MDGTDGQNGTNGTDGVSPTVTVTDITGGHQVSITDASSTQTFNVMNGADGRDGTNGTNGTDGVSPTIDVVTITGGHRVDITDAQGSESFTVMDGADGQDGTNGQDGVSPTVSVTSITGGHQVSITDAQGTDTFNVMDGQDGQNGTNGTDGVTPDITMTATADATSSANPTVTVTKGGTTANPTFALAFSGLKGEAGANGQGVPTGGTAGQVLAKVDGTDYNTEWVTPSGGGGETLTEIYETVSGETVNSLFTALCSLISVDDTIVIHSNSLLPLSLVFVGTINVATLSGTPAITFSTISASSGQYDAYGAYILMPRRWQRTAYSSFETQQSFEAYEKSWRDGGWKYRYYFGMAPSYEIGTSGVPQCVKPSVSVSGSSVVMRMPNVSINNLTISSGIKVYKVG